jgi:hypothetical protein
MRRQSKAHDKIEHMIRRQICKPFPRPKRNTMRGDGLGPDLEPSPTVAECKYQTPCPRSCTEF